MKLVIAEKPSVAKDIASVIGATTLKDKYYEGNDYIVSWAVGHLLTLKMPEMYNSFYEKWKIVDLPIIPKPFEYFILKNTKQQFEVLKNLWNRDDVDTIICGTDAGREGELIFRLISNEINNNKNMKRLWISSMTSESIQEGFKNLRPLSDYDKLYESALARQQADWLVGINATRYYSIKAQSKLTSGRVQTPTLNLIVKRQEEINNFKKSYYYNLVANFETFKATYYDDDNNSKIEKELAQNILSQLENEDFKITDMKTEEKKVERPQLFDLTSLQREANKKYSYTASQTLEVAQSLYEKWKLITYPRTDSNCLSDDMKEPTKLLLKKLNTSNIFNCNIYNITEENMLEDKRIYNNLKVSDHHAIIPTNNICSINLNELPEKESNILKLIVQRFFVAFSNPYIYEEKTITLNAKNHIFKAKSNHIINLGWKSIISDPQESSENNSIDLEINTIIKPINLTIEEKEVSMPKPYTEDTLLSAMENCKKYLDKDSKEFLSKGIGTPATRAEVIEKLIQTEYVIRDKRNLLPTEKGINFINIVDEKLKSIDISADWEEKFTFIEKGTLSVSDFLDEIIIYISDIVNSKNNTVIDSNLFKKQLISIGKCPLCKNDILEGKNNFYCSAYKDGCSFSISKIIAQKKLSNKNITDLLKKGSTSKISGFISKSNKPFEATLTLENGKIKFNF